jgi:hypothetical protein
MHKPDLYLTPYVSEARRINRLLTEGRPVTRQEILDLRRLRHDPIASKQIAAMLARHRMRSPDARSAE